MTVIIERCTSCEQIAWFGLREAFWPHCSGEEHLSERESFIADTERFVQFVAYEEPRSPAGFVEASLRRDYVNGTSGSPVAFLEGIYVLPRCRRRGIAAQLVGAVAQWATSRGCRELASDTLLENELSQVVHKALGFRQTEHVVFFRKPLVG